MKSAKFSTLLKILALALSLLVLCGSLPAGALDTDPTEAPSAAGSTEAPGPTDPPVGETVAPTDGTPDPAEDSTEAPTEEPSATEAPEEEPSEPTITITALDKNKNEVTGAYAAGLDSISVVIRKLTGEDTSKLAVVFVPTSEYIGKDEENATINNAEYNLTPNKFNRNAIVASGWITPGYNPSQRSANLDFTKEKAPELKNRSYTLAVRDGLGNVVEREITVLVDPPQVTIEAVPSGWHTGNVDVYFTVTGDAIASVTYTDNKTGGTYDAEHVSGDTYVKSVSESCDANRYTFTATDKAGNTGSATLSQAIQIDSAAPSLTLLGYTDGKKEISPETTWLAENQTISAIVQASDTESGLDLASFKVGETQVKKLVSKGGGKYWIELSKPAQVNTISVSDKSGKSNSVDTEAFRVDNEAPASEDFEIYFTLPDSAFDKILNFILNGVYSNSQIDMTVKVNARAKSDITSIVAKSGSTTLSKGEITDDGHGNFSATFKIPINNTDPYNVVFEATDAVGNRSAAINLKDLRKVYISGTALEEGSSLYEVVAASANHSPENTAFSLSKPAVDSYYSTANGTQTVSLTVADHLAGLRDDVKIYFGKSEDFTMQDDQYTDLPAALTEFKSFERVYSGSEGLSGKCIEQQIAFDLPEDLASGTYTVLMAAGNYAGEEGSLTYLRQDIKVDNSGPTLAQPENAMDPAGWTNGAITVSFQANDALAGINFADITVTDANGDKVTSLTDKGDGLYAFTATRNQKFTVTAKDKLGNSAEPLEINVTNHDGEAPVIKITKYEPDGSKKWVNSPVTVTFTVTENTGEYDEPTVEGATVTPVSGGYTFVVDKHGKYTISVQDKATNKATKPTAEIKVDTHAPQIEKVEFSTEKGSFKKFGIYDSKAITATVYVRSIGDAPVKSITMYNKKNGEKIALAAVETTPNTNVNGDANLYSMTFPLGTGTEPYDLSIAAMSAAELDVEKNIEDLDLYFVDDLTKYLVQTEYKEAFELVLTEAKPTITFTDAITGYTSKPDVNGIVPGSGMLFAGAAGGTLNAQVVDQLSGIMKITSITFDGVDIKNDAVFTLSATQKVTEVPISYTFSEKLSSGKHTLEIEAKNNAGNSRKLKHDFYLDQTAPEGSYSAKKEWTNQPIEVTVNVEDDADELGYNSGVKGITVDEGAVAVTHVAGGIFTFSATERKDYTVVMTDHLENSRTLTVKAEDIWFDNQAPALVGNQFTFPNDEWQSPEDGIEVSFALTDDLSGVDADSIVVTGDANGKTYPLTQKTTDDNGVVSCKFIADYYQTYTVTVNDKVKENQNAEKPHNTASFTTDSDDKLKVDTTDPEITSVTFAPAESAVDKVLNVLTFGLYSNDDILMTVAVKDPAASSGIKDITVNYNDDETVTIDAAEFAIVDPNETSDVTASRVFTLSISDKDYDPGKIELQVTDGVGKTSALQSVAALYQAGKVFVSGSGEALDFLEEGFNIVSSDAEPDIKATQIDTIKLEGKGKTTVGTNLWFRGDKGSSEVTVSTTVTAPLTKLHEVKVYLNDTDITDKVVGAGTYTKYNKLGENESNAVVDEVSLSFSTGTLASAKRASGGDAKNVVKIVAVGNNSEEQTAERTFYIDDTVPEIESISFSVSAADKILNILTFGLYSSNEIEMTVAVKDNGPASGVKTITLTGPEDDERIEAADFTATSDTLASDGAVAASREYTFTVSDKKYDPAAIKLSVTDHTGNISENKTLAALNTEEKLYTGSETATLFDEDQFEIVSTSKKPTITGVKLTGTPEPYKDSDGKAWYQGDDFDEVGLTFTASDPLSKLHSVKAYVNDKDKGIVINDIYTNFTDEAANTSDGKDQSMPSKSFSVNTAESSVKGLLNRVSKSASGNKFIIDVCANSSLTATDQSGIFYIDDAAPYITAFKFSGDGYSDVYSDSENGGLHAADVELTDYGFYFKSTTDVTVTASDYVTTSKVNGSGVKAIGFRFVDVNGNTYDYGERAVNDKNQATFTVKADFKGSIYAYAVDNVTNKGSEITPAGLIVESGSAHATNSDSSVSFGDANYHGKDNNDVDLFSGDVTVSFTVSDTISGLRDAEYTVTNGSEVVAFQKVKVSNKGVLDNSSWKIATREEGTNLVTRLTLTDTISASSFNANNLVVTVKAHDRAGYEIEKSKKCSIDITKPKIDITFDPKDPVNVDAGNNYFSTARTATITVTERNFNPKDFDWSKMIAIEGTVPGFAAGADWSTSYTDYTDSSTHVATVTFAEDGKYEVILNFTDMAGNKADQVDAGQFYIDKTVPTLSVSLSPDREYSNSPVTATVTIVEHNFNPDAKYLTLTPHYFAPDQTTGKSGPSLSGWSSSGDTHTATMTFSEDGKYSFDITFMDLALNKATPYTGKVFYVDQTKPAITFSKELKNDKAYNTQVRPEFDVFDYNYAGAESVNYSLTRHAYDFTTGTQIPVTVSKSGVTTSYIEGVIKQLFSYPLLEKTESNDGVYVLSVSATDRAGNTSDPASITFSVNCFGSVFLLASDETIEVADSGYTKNAPDIMIKEINVNQLKDQKMTLSYNNSNQSLEKDTDYTITPSGGGNQWYEYLYKIPASFFTKEGNYTVTASSTDVKLNTVTTNRTVNEVDDEDGVHKNCPVSFIVDKTAPNVTISGVEENGAYSEAEREIQITCLDDNLDKDSVQLLVNGVPVELTPDQIDDTLVGQLDINYTILASGEQTDYKVEVIAKDYAGVSGSAKIDKFTLSATWLTMFFHNTVAVIAASVVLAALLALGVFLAIRKRRMNAE